MHWTQPHVFSEIHRYSLVEELKMIRPVNDTNAYLTLRLEDGRTVRLPPEEEVLLLITTSSKTPSLMWILDSHPGKSTEHLL